MARERLYDLVFDPNEARNLADNPLMAGMASDTRNRLATDLWLLAATSQPGVKQVSQPVSEHVYTIHHYAQREAWP
jgi:hypothetical protein